MTWQRFPQYWPLLRESTSDWWIPSTRTSYVELWCLFVLLLAWTNCWTNSGVAGNLRWHGAHVRCQSSSVGCVCVWSSHLGGQYYDSGRNLHAGGGVRLVGTDCPRWRAGLGRRTERWAGWGRAATRWAHMRGTVGTYGLFGLLCLKTNIIPHLTYWPLGDFNLISGWQFSS